MPGIGGGSKRCKKWHRVVDRGVEERDEGQCQAVQTGPKNSTSLDAERAMAWKPRSARMQPASKAESRRRTAPAGASTPGRVKPPRVKSRIRSLVLRHPAAQPGRASRSARQRTSGADTGVSDTVMTAGGAVIWPGPRSFEESMEDWRDMQKAALWHHVPASMECLDDVYSRGVNVTTHYSGTGAAEMAVAKVLRGSVHFHGACDFSPTCQHVLLNHGPTDKIAGPTDKIPGASGSRCVDAWRETQRHASRRTQVGGRCHESLGEVDPETRRHCLLSSSWEGLPGIPATRQCFDAGPSPPRN